MTYNVENLFDSLHDEGKEDWEFLPTHSSLKENCITRPSYYRDRCFETDWTSDKFRHKLNQIAKSVLAQGSLPDVLALQEVENENTVRNLAEVLGYENYVFEEGQDRRGIDVALLFDSKKLSYLDHRSRIAPGLKNTRDILAVYFQIKGEGAQNVLAVYVNHWPSQASPAPRRILAAKGLRAFMDKDRRRFGRAFHGVATGDFNVIHADFPHPFHTVIAATNSNLSGEPLVDVLGRVPKKVLQGQPFGTHFYPVKMSWSHLDRFFVTKNLLDGNGPEVLLDSYRIGIKGNTTSYTYDNDNDIGYGDGSVVRGVPYRFNANYSHRSKSGYSDHFPVTVEIRL